MADTLRDLGLQVADNLPGALAGLTAIIVLALWGIYKAHAEDSGAKVGVTIVLIGVILGALAGFSTAYSSAQQLCRTIGATTAIPNPIEVDVPWETPETLRIANYEYYAAKCHNLWPNGQGL